jgi:hypothetical protein
MHGILIITDHIKHVMVAQAQGTAAHALLF